MKWKVAEPISEEFRNKFPEIDPVILQLLANRGVKTQEQIDEFLYPDYGPDIHDPFLFLDMEKAVERVFRAVEKGEKITVHGDYDADGVCSALIVVSTLEAMGAKAEVYLPHRELEGYGLNMQTVEELGKRGTNLIITTDCGISNREEIKRAVELGMEVIVTDHHAEPLNLPEAALAIINPHLAREKYPFKELSGAGVAFKFVQGILHKIKTTAPKIEFREDPEGFEKWLLDLTAIATIADIMPLLGENRTIVKYGLIVLNKTKRLGLKKMIDSLGLNKAKLLDARNVSFQISPRLNAAGRIDHANQAYELLKTSDGNEVDKLVAALNKTNEDRQALSERVTAEAKEKIGEEVGERKVLFAVGKGWPIGIVGLVAGKIADNLWRPTFIMAEKEGNIMGSGRSIPEFDIMEGLREAKEFLSHYGGHAGACGFTLKNKKDLKRFEKTLEKFAEKKLAGSELVPSLNIDSEVKLEKINWELFELLEKFSPFGKGNERPRYLGRGLTVESFEGVGNNGNHLRINLSHENGQKKKFIGFCFGSWCEKLKAGDKIDVVFEIDVNEWNGNRELQMKIIDLKHSE